MKEMHKFLLILVVFLFCYLLPLELLPFSGPAFEALALLKWYAREHVILCLVPAFFIAGGICVFISQASVMKYFGAKANKFLSYSVASVSGAILAVCSCTILPMFCGIYKRGAGLGPAIAFLYSGPAISVLAIVLTAKVLGWPIGLARGIGAVVFSVVIGLLMHAIFSKEERKRQESGKDIFAAQSAAGRPLWQEAVFFGAMIVFLVFANFARPAESRGVWHLLYASKWLVAIASLGILALSLRWFKRDELKEWVSSTWAFSKQILPVLLFGVLISGFLLGRPGHEGIIPSRFVNSLVGGNSFFANFFSSVVGAFMYFATLTEVPIVEGLLGSGMGKGPALALLLAGPALSLPSMLVIKSAIGFKKTFMYVFLVVIMATISGFAFGLMMK